MKPVACAFLLLFGYAHIQGDLELAIARPLSLFREQGIAWVGYAMFLLLLSAVGLLFIQLIRLRWFFDAAFLIGTGVMLAGVAATSSFGVLHNFLAFLVLFSTYVYFATVFYRLGSRWLLVHLVIPVVLVIATQFHSYGLWQKSIVLYYLFTVVLQHHLCVDWLRTAKRSQGGYTPPRRDGQRRQKVFRLDE